MKISPAMMTQQGMVSAKQGPLMRVIPTGPLSECVSADSASGEMVYNPVILIHLASGGSDSGIREEHRRILPVSVYRKKTV
jgi:hypothetical protein